MEQSKIVLQMFETNKTFKDKLVETSELQGEDFTVINALIYLFSKICELGMDEQVLEDLENKYDNYDTYIYDNQFLKDLRAKYPIYKESLLGDVDNGFFGKTAIHPVQLPVIAKSNIVEEEDYQDALNIMGMSSGLIGVAKGHSGNKMNEVKTHSHWAKKIIAQANVYGVKTTEKEEVY